MIASGSTLSEVRKESRYEERISCHRRAWEATIGAEVSGNGRAGSECAVSAAAAGGDAVGPRWLRAVAGDHLQRWVASALLKVESRFRRLKGHKEMPALLSALDDYALQNGLVQQTKAA